MDAAVEAHAHRHYSDWSYAYACQLLMSTREWLFETAAQRLVGISTKNASSSSSSSVREYPSVADASLVSLLAATIYYYSGTLAFALNFLMST